MKNLQFKLIFSVTLTLILVIGGFLWQGFNLKPQEIPSALIGLKVPKFKILTLEDPNVSVDESFLRGHISVLNVWATWCVTCQKEHSFWMAQKETGLPSGVQLIGLNYHDNLTESQSWLKKLGNPYQFNIFDEKGLVGIEFGVYGTPETYIIDKSGIVRYRHVGPMTHQVWQNTILPLIKN